jgi:hypothetical protein
MGEKSGSGIRFWDEQPGSYIRELRNNFWVKILKFFDAAPDQGSGIKNLYEPGSGIGDGKNSDPGSVISIPDPQHRNSLWVRFLF